MAISDVHPFVLLRIINIDSDDSCKTEMTFGGGLEQKDAENLLKHIVDQINARDMGLTSEKA